MQYVTMLLVIGIVLVMGIMGCKEDKDNTTVVQPPSGLQTYQPKGTITGLIKDTCTNAAVSGAVLSVGYDGGVQTVTSDAAGAFSFANVPVGRFQVVGGGFVFTGTYTLTASLVSYNASQPDSNRRYRNYYYNTVTIIFTSLVPGDSLGVSGMVGSIVFNISNLNTIVTGQVVDANQQPVANAIVTLFDQSITPGAVLAQTTTSASGIYRFSRVDNGLTLMIRARNSDGSLEGSLPANMTLPCNLTFDSLRSQVQAERIILNPADNVNPFVIDITPEHNADVSPTGLQVVYVFSEPIKQTAYTRTDLPIGHNTMIDDITFSYDGLKKTTGPIPFSAQWNATFTQLTLTPQGVTGSARYSVDARTAFTSGNITDQANRALVNNASITGDFEILRFTTTSAAPVPSAPVVVRRYVPGVFSTLDYTGGTVGLEWNFDANVRSYNIYKSVGVGSYELLQRNYFGLQFSDNTGSLVTPQGANNPLSAISVRYHVRAINRDLVEGSASNAITVTDSVKPRLITASVAAAPPPAGTNTWLYTLQFSEPLTLSNAENPANYTFSDPGSPPVVFIVNRADYLGFNGGTNRYHVQLLVTTSAPLPGTYTLFVPSSASGVLDFAGNPMDPSANSRTF